MATLLTRPRCCDCDKDTATFWCKNCTNAYCQRCKNEVHSRRAFHSHLVMPIDALNFTSDLKETLSLAVRRLEQDEKVIKSYNTDEKAKVTELFKSLRLMIDDHEKVILNKIKALEKKTEELSKTHLTQLGRKRDELSTQYEKFESILSSQNDTEINEFVRKNKESLNKTKGELVKLEIPTQTEFNTEGCFQLKVIVSDALKKIPIIVKQEEGHKQNALDSSTKNEQQPVGLSSNSKLDCGGHACAKCGCCRDWYHDNFANNEPKYKKAEGATCREGFFGPGFHYYHYHGTGDYYCGPYPPRLCACDNNTNNSST